MYLPSWHSANIWNVFLRELKKSKPKDYWDILNEACEKKPKESPVDANTFVEHFRELNINAHTATQQEPNEQDADLDSTSLNTPFTEQEVRKQIQRLKNGKACGIDAIVNEFIKSSPPEMVALLVKFFNLILISETMPSNWSIGVIIPIFKNKGTQTDPGNYRGITLLSCLGKLFTGLINQRLSKFLDSNGLLGEEQAGFREGYSTMDHTLTLNLIIEFLLSKHKRLYCAFIDYHKAFDTVDRTHLWTKLFSTGIHGRILNVVKSIYKEAQSCVRHNGEVSQLFPCNNGVRQGDNLSPLLFSIYLNDLQVFLSKQCKGIVIENKGAEFAHYVQLFTLLYADDTILLGESAQDLQVALDSLYSYCERWNLKVNENKTKVVVFSRGKVRKVPEWRFGPHTITTQYDYTYLGVSFNYNGLFEKAMGKQVTQAKRALFSLVAKFRKLNLPLDIQCHLVDSCITPILLYGSEVWGSANIKQVEVFHNQLCKQILHLGRKTANCIPLGELGRFTMAHFVKQRMLNYWANLVNGKQSKLSSTVYNLLKNLHDQGVYQSKWLSCISDNLNEMGIGYLWNSQEFSTNWFKHTISQISKDTSVQNLRSAIIESGHCQTYKTLKCNMDFEPYLTMLDKKYAIPLCKFRTGNNKLPIVTGRHKNTPRNERFCLLCPDRKLGDEYHYIFECTHFTEKRSQLIDRRFLIDRSDIAMCRLFNTLDVNHLKQLATFVYLIMDACQ